MKIQLQNGTEIRREIERKSERERDAKNNIDSLLVY